MTRIDSHRCARNHRGFIAAALMAAAFGVAAPAAAQTATATPLPSDANSASPSATNARPATASRPRSPAVGDVTHKLFALQASGESASTVARPIAGDVAQKSYQRYLNTFDLPIPATFTTTVKSGNK